MRNSIYVYIVAVSLVLCGLAGISWAQGAEGETYISYDDATGTVTAYGETVSDLDTDYANQTSLTVKDQNGVTVASGSDYQLYNNASVALQFAAVPGSVYTATTNHCLRLQSWGYDNVYPYRQYYYDNWDMSSFLGRNIYEPWDYWFASPGYREIYRTIDVICIGKTYDTVEAPPTVTITKADGSALPNPYRIGINGGGHDRTQHLKATISPSSKTSGVTIEVSARITKSNVSTTSNVISFDVVGNAASPAGHPGEESISASYSGTPIASTNKPVSVVVPSKVSNQSVGSLTVANVALGPGSQPSYYGLPNPTDIILVTTYCKNVTVSVQDQFNALIGDVYSGATVIETISGSDVIINQNLNSSSTYNDPVCRILPSTLYELGPIWPASNTTLIASWATERHETLDTSSANVSYPVKIDGFTLDPGLGTRTLTTSPSSTVTIAF